MRLAFRVSYIGDEFWGSQIQPDQRTVEGEFIASCKRLKLFEDWRNANFSSAGRTDRGVHARSQVVAFNTNFPDRAIQALNLHLPDDCWCTGWAEVGEDFHPRYKARTRTYRYYFLDKTLDITLMQETATRFIGTHDFSRFARVADKKPIRTILSCEVFHDDPCIVFEVTGESFLWNMVRCMAIVLEQRATGKLDMNSFEKALEGEAGFRFPASPAEGLVLWDVDCGVDFHSMEINPKRRDFNRSLLKRIVLKKKVIEELCGLSPDFGGQ